MFFHRFRYVGKIVGLWANSWFDQQNKNCPKLGQISIGKIASRTNVNWTNVS
jgi:hypothetical protein